MDEIKKMCEELLEYLDACCDLPLRLLGKEGITSKEIKKYSGYYKLIYEKISIEFHNSFINVFFNDLLNIQIKAIIEDIFEIKPDLRNYYSSDYTNNFDTDGYYYLKVRDISYSYIENIKVIILKLYGENVS